MVFSPYRVVKAGNLLDLQVEVNKAIAKGWRPIGGVSFGEWLVPNKRVAMQAMIWKESNNG